jgi:cytoskeletal protein RodZ
MTTDDPHVSLADVELAGIPITHIEAVTIVRNVVLRASRGDLPGVPSAHVIRLSAAGMVPVEGPVAADDRAVPRAAHLLDALLPGFDAPADRRVPGALRLIVGRALGTLDLPPYTSLDAFAQALGRFESADPRTTIADLVRRVISAGPLAAPRLAVPRREQAGIPEPSDQSLVQTGGQADRAIVPPVRLEPREMSLTISDIRRARRATGLTLAQISERSQISARLLVELEWGYMRNWPASQFGRSQLVRYARAAGLDDHLVVRTVWPLLEEAVRDREFAAPLEISVVAISESVLQNAQDAPAVNDTPAGQQRSRKRYLAALAIPALLALGIVPALWNRSVETPSSNTQQASEPPGRSARVAGPLSGAGGTGASDVPSIPPTVTSADPAPRAAATHLRLSTPASAPRRDDAMEPRAPTVTRAASATLVASPVGGIPDVPAYSPSFASVGSAMFYQAQSDGRSALMRADTDSRGAILRITSVVDDHAQNFHARQSPDGRSIAFDSDRDGERGVYLADADGNNVRRISGDGFAAIPSWSPDGQSIAFVRAEADRPKVWNLWTTDVSSGRSRRLTSYKVGAPWGGSWFPDGRRIAYSHETNLVVLDLETGRQRVFESPIGGRLVRTPAVSPDGERVMFQVYRDGAWLLELADGSMRKVLSDPSAEEYTWAPDGQRVAYHSRSAGSWGVWIMAPR